MKKRKWKFSSKCKSFHSTIITDSLYLAICEAEILCKEWNVEFDRNSLEEIQIYWSDLRKNIHGEMYV